MPLDSCIRTAKLPYRLVMSPLFQQLVDVCHFSTTGPCAAYLWSVLSGCSASLAETVKSFQAAAHYLLMGFDTADGQVSQVHPLWYLTKFFEAWLRRYLPMYLRLTVRNFFSLVHGGLAGKHLTLFCMVVWFLWAVMDPNSVLVVGATDHVKDSVYRLNSSVRHYRLNWTTDGVYTGLKPFKELPTISLFDCVRLILTEPTMYVLSESAYTCALKSNMQFVNVGCCSVCKWSLLKMALCICVLLELDNFKPKGQINYGFGSFPLYPRAAVGLSPFFLLPLMPLLDELPEAIVKYTSGERDLLTAFFYPYLEFYQILTNSYPYVPGNLAPQDVRLHVLLLILIPAFIPLIELVRSKFRVSGNSLLGRFMPTRLVVPAGDLLDPWAVLVTAASMGLVCPIIWRRKFAKTNDLGEVCSTALQLLARGFYSTWANLAVPIMLATCITYALASTAEDKLDYDPRTCARYFIQLALRDWLSLTGFLGATVLRLCNNGPYDEYMESMLASFLVCTVNIGIKTLLSMTARAEAYAAFEVHDVLISPEDADELKAEHALSFSFSTLFRSLKGAETGFPDSMANKLAHTYGRTFREFLGKSLSWILWTSYFHSTTSVIDSGFTKMDLASNCLSIVLALSHGLFKSWYVHSLNADEQPIALLKFAVVPLLLAIVLSLGAKTHEPVLKGHIDVPSGRSQPRVWLTHGLMQLFRYDSVLI